LQALNAAEACNEDRQSPHWLVVYDTETVAEQIRGLLSKLGYVDLRVRRRDFLFRCFYPILFIWWYRAKRGRLSRVYFGTYTSWASFLINYLQVTNHTLIDDGQKTINILTAPQLVGLKRQRSWMGWFARDYVYQAEFFTFYDNLAREHGRKCRPNRLKLVSELLLDDELPLVAVDRETILFLGTNVLGRITDYEDVMRRVVGMAGGRRIVYLMHRKDDADYLKKLSDRLGFYSVRFDVPLELVFLRLWSLHKPEVWTFGTTAADTLQAMHNELHITLLRLPEELFTHPQLAAAFSSIYSHYKGNARVRLVDLPQKSLGS
jgi:hypothetical protein